MKQSVEIDDLIRIKSIINEFSALHDEFETYESDLNKMQEEQAIILEKLNVIKERIIDLRERESLVIKEMQIKYGENFVVDLENN